MILLLCIQVAVVAVSSGENFYYRFILFNYKVLETHKKLIIKKGKKPILVAFLIASRVKLYPTGIKNSLD